MLERGAWIAWIVCVACIACAPESIVVSLDLEAHASALMVVEGTEEIQAYAVDASSTAIAEYPSGSSLHFTALLYERSLADLGLAPGRVTLVGADDPGRALPVPIEALERSVANDEATPWRKIDALRPEIAGLRLEPKCRTPESLWLRPLPDAIAASLIAVTATSAWIIGTNEAEESLVWEAGATGIRNIVSPLPRMPKFSAAVRARDGTIYVVLKTPANLDSELFAGTPSRGFSPRTPAPPWTGSISLAAANDPSDPAAFYALAGGVRLHRYEADPDRWTLLSDMECGYGRAGNVFADLGRDDVLCNGPGGHIQRSSAGQRTAERLPSSGQSLAALAHFPGLGTFAGSLEGYIFERSGEVWQTIYAPDAVSVQEIRSFEVGRDRTLYIGGNLGSIGQYHAESGLCSLEYVLALGVTKTVKQLVALDDVVLFIADEEISANVHALSVGAIR